MADTLLDIRDLKTWFKTDDGMVRAVDGIDLRIDRGETVGVVGESGCGKTVTARSVLKCVFNPRMSRRASPDGAAAIAMAVT